MSDEIKNLRAELAARLAAEKLGAYTALKLTQQLEENVRLTQQIAALRAGIGAIADGCLIRGYDSIAEDLCALLTPPSAEADDEIRMPMSPGIPGVGVVVRAGPRPELVIERDISVIDCERCGAYIELEEHEGDLCNDCRRSYDVVHKEDDHGCG